MLINHIIKYLLAVTLLMIVATACRKDEGNYAYHDINELEIANIPDTVRVAFAANTVIRPELKFTKDADPAKFSFLYVVVDPNLTGQAMLKTVGVEKDLDVELPLGQGRYTAFYTVTENATGVKWTREFKIEIAGAFATKGWFFLSEVEGKGNLQFFEEKMTSIGTFPVRYTDFVSLIADKTTEEPLKLEGKPKFLNVGSTTIFTAEQTNKIWLYIGSEGATQKVNISNGYLWKSPTYPFVYETANMYPAAPDWVYYPTPGEGYAFYNGELYTHYFPQRRLFGIPVNRLTNGEVLDLHPAMAIPSSLTLVAFDKTLKRFVRHQGATSNYMATLPASATGFDPNNMGMDLVWMGYTTAFSGQAVAILLKTDGKRFIARMGFTRDGAFDATSLEEIASPELLQAQHYTVDKNFGYLFFSIGSKLYKYDMDAKSTTLLKDYGGNNQITLVKNGLHGVLPAWSTVERFPASYNATQLAPPIKGVVVAYYDPANPNTSGKVDVLDVSQPAVSSYYSFEGFGKVVDITYLNN